MTGQNVETRRSEVRERMLEHIAKEIETKGFPPTVRELGKALGLRSPSTVHAHLEVLRRQGRIVSDPTKPRTIQIVEEGKVDESPNHKASFSMYGNHSSGLPRIARNRG